MKKWSVPPHWPAVSMPSAPNKAAISSLSHCIFSTWSKMNIPMDSIGAPSILTYQYISMYEGNIGDT